MLSPSAHYEKADALMARVDEMKNAALPISVALVAQAMVHATLAQCCDLSEWEDDYTHYYPPTRGLETWPATGGRL